MKNSPDVENALYQGSTVFLSRIFIRDNHFDWM